MPTLSTIEFQTAEKVDASIIWLHGLGANGHDFEPIVPQLRLPGTTAIRFIFPNAPSIPVTINGGMVMPAWYDITDASIERQIDHEQIMKSSQWINELIKQEIDRGVDSKRIIIAGFSQGGAVAYQVALTYPEPLAGLMALSTYFATSQTIKPSAENQNIPILVCHGTLDMVVPEILGRNAIDSLNSMGYKAQYHTYPMQHSVDFDEIENISNWIQEVLA
ncbi:MAG: alpha/beta hydrolase [Gammaproteobacteria bacterium]|jgi:phospholipase/carboxylesterase